MSAYFEHITPEERESVTLVTAKNQNYGWKARA